MTCKIPHSWLLLLMVLLLLSTFSTLRRHIPFPVLLQTVIFECTSFSPPLYCLYYSNNFFLKLLHQNVPFQIVQGSSYWKYR
jgi:hypothetical protein